LTLLPGIINSIMGEGMLGSATRSVLLPSNVRLRVRSTPETRIGSRSEVSGRNPDQSPENRREVALVREARQECHFAQLRVTGREPVAGLLDASQADVFAYSSCKVLSERTCEVDAVNSSHPGQGLERRRVDELVVEILAHPREPRRRNAIHANARASDEFRQQGEPDSVDHKWRERVRGSKLAMELVREPGRRTVSAGTEKFGFRDSGAERSNDFRDDLDYQAAAPA
jgi:hypothetical protein